MSKGNIVPKVKGVNHIRPMSTTPAFDSAQWQDIVDISRSVLEGYGYGRLWTPVLEHTDLFTRGIGEGTDVVGKEMFTFESRGKKSLTLRPEGTASAARLYAAEGLAQDAALQRWWYFGSMYRAEQPQEGRYREFYQIGAELFGADSVVADAEMIFMLHRLTQRLGLDGLEILVNSLGDEESRVAYRAVLLSFLRAEEVHLCTACVERIEKNPLRVLDCKRHSCKAILANAPLIADSLSSAAADRFSATTALLTELGVAFKVAPHLVRGLDYYTGLIFEFETDALGAQGTILAGGRYDGLVQELGGARTPAIGFSAGVERIALLRTKSAEHRPLGPHLYIIALPGLHVSAFTLAEAVRNSGQGVRVEVDVAGGKLKKSVRRADRRGAAFVLVLGPDEVKENRGTLKQLALSSSAELSLDPKVVAEYVLSGA